MQITVTFVNSPGGDTTRTSIPIITTKTATTVGMSWTYLEQFLSDCWTFLTSNSLLLLKTVDLVDSIEEKQLIVVQTPGEWAMDL